PEAHDLRERDAPDRLVAQADLHPILRHRDGVHPVRRRNRFPLPVDARLPVVGVAAFPGNVLVSPGPGGGIRLHLEERRVQLVSHTRYRVAEAGESRKFPPEAMAQIEKILQRYPTKQAALLPVLWVAQETWGWISKEAAEEVSRILELPP